MNILLADNDPTFLNLCAEFLEDSGYQVLRAQSPAEVRQILQTSWVHLLIIDVRLTDDNDTSDKSGMKVAQEVAGHVPVMVLTRYPAEIPEIVQAISPDANGKRTIIDYVEKRLLLPELLERIKKNLQQYVRINPHLKIEWKACDRYSLPTWMEPELGSELVINRVEEIEDLLRACFRKKDHIRLHHFLWKRDGRVALVALTFQDQVAPEAYLMVCGLETKINQELDRFKLHAPKAPGNFGVTLVDRAQTTHYAINLYSLVGSNLENVMVLRDLYTTNAEKMINLSLDTLFGQTLHAWHIERSVHSKVAWNAASSLGVEANEFETLFQSILDNAPILGIKIRCSDSKLHLSIGPHSFSYANPVLALNRVRGNYPTQNCWTSPGVLNSSNVLVDGRGGAWLTDFSNSGLYPVVWNFACLEGDARYSRVDMAEFGTLHDLERCLVFGDFNTPDTDDLDPSLRRPVRTILAIRRHATRIKGFDLHSYSTGLMIQALQTLVNYIRQEKWTTTELLHAAHLLLSLAMLETGIGNKPLQTEQGLSMLDRDARLILVDGRKEHLSVQLFKVFVYLFDNSNRVCSRQELAKNALGGKYDDEYLHQLIGRIRKILKDDPRHPRYLVTEFDSGYRLILKPEDS